MELQSELYTHFHLGYHLWFDDRKSSLASLDLDQSCIHVFVWTVRSNIGNSRWWVLCCRSQKVSINPSDRSGCPGEQWVFLNDFTCQIELNWIELNERLLIITVYLSASFIIPVIRGRWKQRRLQDLALRSLISAIAALITSGVNICLLTALDGHQLG
jgi:hypothetical protein